MCVHPEYTASSAMSQIRTDSCHAKAHISFLHTVCTHISIYRLHTAGYVLVRSYKILAWSASRHNRARWQLKPKHHHILEGIHHAKKTLRNPRAHWLFKHEDFVGRIARLASKAHPTTCAKRALQLWAIKMALIRPKGFAHRFIAKHGRKFRKLSFKR